MTTSKKILIIDDEQDLVKVIKFRLKKEGYEVSEAYDGVEGIAKAASVQPDLIILDMQMPKMNGLEFYRQMLDDENKTRYPILVLTARGEIRDLFCDMHADGFMTKPFENEELVKEITLILDKTSKGDQADQSQETVEHGTNKIIIADDDEAVSDRLVLELVKKGYMVSTVKSGLELMQRAHKDLPDLIMIKMDLPELPGYDAASKLKQMARTSHIPLVLYTMNHDANFKMDIIDNILKTTGLTSKDIVSSTNITDIISAASNYLKASSL